MLILHCGWPRTGTTSLQAGLSEHVDKLALAGICYPDQWRSGIGLTHHGLANVLQAGIDSAPEFNTFMRFLEANSGRSILFSAEVLSSWLILDERRRAFLRFLAAAQEVIPTRCIWTLRRYDEFIRSWLLFGVKQGGRRLERARTAVDVENVDTQFEGMRMVEEAVQRNAVYVKYESDGAHNEKLLHAFGVCAKVANEIQAWIKDNANLNAGPTHKQAAALFELDALSARAGVSLDESRLRAAFRRGEFEFEDDGRCELADRKRQRRLHEAALSAAHRHGIHAYVDFFQDPSNDVFREPEGEASAITDVDLERLVSFLQRDAGGIGTDSVGDDDAG